MGQILLNSAAVLFDLYRWVMIIYIFMSWLPNVQNSKFGVSVAYFVEPYLGIFRKIIPPMGGIDFSPILAFIAYAFLTNWALDGLRAVLLLFN